MAAIEEATRRLPVVRGSRRRALWLATLGFFGGFAGVAIFGPLVPRFVQLLHLTPVQAGMLAAIPNLTGSLLRIPFGGWVDRAGGKKPFLVLLGLTLAGIAGLLAVLRTHYPDRMAGLYPVLLVLGVLIGAGIATFSVGIPQVSYWFPRNRQGGPLGIYAGLGNAAPGLFSWLLPVAVGALGLLTAYAFWFAFLLVVTLIYAVGIEDAPWFQLRRRGYPVTEAQLAALGQDLVPAGSAWEGLRRAAREPATWALVVFYFTSFGGFLALTGWLPTFWHVMYPTSLATGGLLTLTFSLLASLVRVPGGILADRLSIRYALGGNFALIGLGTLIVAFARDFTLSLLGTIVIALGMGLQNAVVFKLLPRYVPEAVGGASGWVGGLGAFGGFALPPVMGAIAGASGTPQGYAQSFLALTALVVLDLMVVAWLERRTQRSRAGAAGAVRGA